MSKGDGWIDEELFEKIRGIMPLSSVDLLIVYKGKLLLMIRNNEPGKGWWFTPGGRVLYGETLEQTALRELEEETGLSAVGLEKKGVMCHLWPKSHFVTTFFRIDVADDNVRLNSEHSAYRWVDKITDDLHPFVRQMIEESEIFK
jgi:colanic acid biosynthesis protein WcaH